MLCGTVEASNNKFATCLDDIFDEGPTQVNF